MGAVNRTQRRKQEREQIRAWKDQGRYGQVLSLQRNGITQKDLDSAYNDGYRNGYLFSAEAFMKRMYAAMAMELIEAGNPKDDVISFVKGVDHRFSVIFDEDEEIDKVYDSIGIRFIIDRNAIDRVEVTKV